MAVDPEHFTPPSGPGTNGTNGAPGRPPGRDDAPEAAAIGHELGQLAGGEADASALGQLARALSRSARAAGARSVASGRWLAGIVMETAPRLPVRDLETLRAHHGGMSGPALASELIRSASRASAAIGAASGALIGVEEFAPPAWITIPVELVVETLATAAIEMKLIAELHEVYGYPVRGSATDRSMALARAWADRRGVKASSFLSADGLRTTLGRGGSQELVRVVRRRLLQRLGRNVGSAAPFLAGALVGAGVNRRGTRSLGEAVVRDLAGGGPPR